MIQLLYNDLQFGLVYPRICPLISPADTYGYGRLCSIYEQINLLSEQISPYTNQLFLIHPHRESISLHSKQNII